MKRLAFLGAITACFVHSMDAGAAAISGAGCEPPYHINCPEEPGLPGVRVVRATAFSASFVAVFSNLCADYVHVTAAPAASDYYVVSDWAKSKGVQVAVNGDYYKSSSFYERQGPGPEVYGLAVGEGEVWPAGKTGWDDPYWYSKRGGWIAFGNNWTRYSHSEWVKENKEVTTGFRPNEVTDALPEDTWALISGFPELVTDGVAHTCVSNAENCFADRGGDQDDRRSRSAMGLTQDSKTFIVLVSNAARGEQLGQLMAELGSHVAFQLDGGKSSELWLKDKTEVNPGKTESAANVWGVYSGAGTGMPMLPGHCLQDAQGEAPDSSDDPSDDPDGEAGGDPDTGGQSASLNGACGLMGRKAGAPNAALWLLWLGLALAYKSSRRMT